MEFLVGLAFGILLTLVIVRLIVNVIRHIKEDELDQKIKDGLSKLKESIIPSRIEQVNNMLYLYNSETEEFLGQGKTMQELNDAVRSRFPNKLFNVPQEELDKFMKKHKKLKE